MTLSTENLIQRIAQKLELLVQLRDLGVHQAMLIESGDMTQLLKLLSAKQRLLTALQSVERALDPYRHDDPETRVWASPEERERCAQAAAACEETLRFIMEQERQSESQMIARRDQAAARLESAHQAAAVQRAYVEESSARLGQLDLIQG
jgi:hypothetical protein